MLRRIALLVVGLVIMSFNSMLGMSILFLGVVVLMAAGHNNQPGRDREQYLRENPGIHQNGKTACNKCGSTNHRNVGVSEKMDDKRKVICNQCDNYLYSLGYPPSTNVW